MNSRYKITGLQVYKDRRAAEAKEETGKDNFKRKQSAGQSEAASTAAAPAAKIAPRTTAEL